METRVGATRVRMIKWYYFIEMVIVNSKLYGGEERMGLQEAEIRAEEIRKVACQGREERH